jgi:hypothetical protein
MDMRMKQGPWLTGGIVQAMGGRYEGTIVDVVEADVRNRFKGKTIRESVAVFEDGKQLVLSSRTQLELINRFGYESDAWKGKQIVIGCRAVKRTDAKTGVVLVTWEKFLLPADSGTATGDPAPEWVNEHEADFSDPIGDHDEDDVSRMEPNPFDRRRD